MKFHKFLEEKFGLSEPEFDGMDDAPKQAIEREWESYVKNLPNDVLKEELTYGPN